MSMDTTMAAHQDGRVRSNERQCTTKYIEASAGTDEQLRSEVPSATGSLGERTNDGKWIRGKGWVASAKAYWVFTNGDSTSPSVGESAA